MSKQSDYANKVYQDALALGIPEPQARLAAAQSSVETGYGDAAPGNAYFGIKAGKSWTGPTVNLTTHEEDASGNLVGQKAKFRAYDTPQASLSDWWNTLQEKWPDAAQASTFDDAVAGLKTGVNGSYATKKSYPTIISRVNTAYLPPIPPLDIPTGSGTAFDALSQFGANSSAPDASAYFNPLPAPAPLTPASMRASIPANPTTDPIGAGPGSFNSLQSAVAPIPMPGRPIALNSLAPVMPSIPKLTPSQIHDQLMAQQTDKRYAGPTVLSGVVQQMVGDAAKNAMPAVNQAIGNTVNSIGKNASQFGNTIGSTASNIGNSIGSMFSGLIPQAKPATSSYAPPTTQYTTQQMQVNNPAYEAYIKAQNADDIGAGPGSFGDLQAFAIPKPAIPAPPKYITVNQRVPLPPAPLPLSSFGTVNPLSQIGPNIAAGFSTTPLGHITQAVSGEPIQGGLLGFLLNGNRSQSPQAPSIPAPPVQPSAYSLIPPSVHAALMAQQSNDQRGQAALRASGMLDSFGMIR